MPSWNVSAGAGCNRLHGLPCWIALRRGRERSTALRLGQLPKHEWRGIAGRLHAVPGWLSVLYWRDRPYSVRGGHDHSEQQGERLHSVRCGDVSVGGWRVGMR